MEEVFKAQLASSVDDIKCLSEELIADPTPKRAFKLYRVLERAQSTVERIEFMAAARAEDKIFSASDN